MKSRFIYVFLSVLILFEGKAQHIPVFSFDQLSDTSDLRSFARVSRSLHKDHLTPSDTSRMNFVSWNDADWLSAPGDEKFDYWIRLTVSASRHTNALWDFHSQLRIHIWMHSLQQQSYNEGGFTYPLHKARYLKNNNLVQTTIEPDSTIAVLIMIRPFKSKPSRIRCSVLTTAAADAQMEKVWSKKRRYFNMLSATLGILGFMAVFAFLQFRVNKDKSFLMYGIYLAALFMYFIKLIEYGYLEPVFWGYFNAGFEISEVVGSMLIIIAYFLFISHFLGIAEKRPDIQKWIRYSIWFCLGFIVIYIIDKLTYGEKGVVYQSYVIFRLAFILLSLYFIFRMYALKSPLFYFVVTGSFFLLAGSAIALIIALTRTHVATTLWEEHYFYFQLGVILEALCFGLGLGYKTHLLDLEKQSAQAALITQQEKEITYQKALGEARISNLRARMNPHFIFNAMNSVQHLILDRQNNKAITYLGRFSKLMRRVLDTSEHSFISLPSEIEILGNYISIENLRLDESFEHHISVPSDIPIDEIMIPQMIVQPFVENAIIHGIKSLTDRKGVLTIEFKMVEEDLMCCIITDNGIGREAATSIRHADHSSQAIQLTEERLKMLGVTVVSPVVVEDLQNPSGTKVTIYLPVKHDF